MVAHDKAPGLYELPGLPQGARPQGARMIDAALVLIQQNNIGEKSSHWTDRGARGSDEVKVDATAHRGIQSAGKSVEGDANHQFLTEFMAADKTYMDRRMDFAMTWLEHTSLANEDLKNKTALQELGAQMNGLSPDDWESLNCINDVGLKFQVEATLHDLDQLEKFCEYNLARARMLKLEKNISDNKKMVEEKDALKKRLRLEIEQHLNKRNAFLTDWKERERGDHSITVETTRARMKPKRKLQRTETDSILLAGESKVLAMTLVDSFTSAMKVTRENLDEKVLAYYKWFWPGPMGEQPAMPLVAFTDKCDRMKLSRAQMTQIFKELDKDKSGSLEKEEFVREITAIFNETAAKKQKSNEGSANDGFDSQAIE